MNQDMQPSAEIRQLVKEFEGLRLDVYCCPGGEWTQGYGHTRGITEKSPRITVEIAERWLDEDLNTAANLVKKHVRVPLNQGQFDSMVSIVFNVKPGAPGKQDGIIWLKRRDASGGAVPSTLLRRLNAADYSGAAAQFERWKYSGGKVLKGLVDRRKIERELFEKK